METVNFYTDNLKIKCFKIRNVITSACIENSDFNVSIYWYLLSTHVRVDNFSNFKFPKSGELITPSWPVRYLCIWRTAAVSLLPLCISLVKDIVNSCEYLFFAETGLKRPILNRSPPQVKTILEYFHETDSFDP